jgi:hypothetical protein
MDAIVMGTATDGTPVAEVEAEDASLDVAELVAEARRRGAGLVWVHGGDLSAHGFVRSHGYVRLHSDAVTGSAAGGETLPSVEADACGPLLAEAYRGLWGHKRVDPSRGPPTDGSVVIGLREGEEWVGLCRFWPGDRLVDGPGVVPQRRTPDRRARLLAAACARLGEGPVDVDTWGEDPATLVAYARLGFFVAEELPGWELRL